MKLDSSRLEFGISILTPDKRNRRKELLLGSPDVEKQGEWIAAIRESTKRADSAPTLEAKDNVSTKADTKSDDLFVSSIEVFVEPRDNNVTQSEGLESISKNDTKYESDGSSSVEASFSDKESDHTHSADLASMSDCKRSSYYN